MSKVKEIVLNQTGQHAIVVDVNNDQWFCQVTREENVSVSDYLIDVYLFFVQFRDEYFHCDVA